MEIEWERNLGGSGDDFARDIRQTSDGGYIVVGTSESVDGQVGGNYGEEDFWVPSLSVFPIDNRFV